MTYEVVSKLKGEVFTLEQYVKHHLKPTHSGVGGSGTIEKLGEEIDDVHTKVDKLAAMFARLLEQYLDTGGKNSYVRKIVENGDAEFSGYRIKDLGDTGE